MGPTERTHLKVAFAEELIQVSRSERYLNDGCEFCHFFCTVIYGQSRESGKQFAPFGGIGESGDDIDDISSQPGSAKWAMIRIVSCSNHVSSLARAEM